MRFSAILTQALEIFSRAIAGTLWPRKNLPGIWAKAPEDQEEKLATQVIRERAKFWVVLNKARFPSVVRATSTSLIMPGTNHGHS